MAVFLRRGVMALLLLFSFFLVMAQQKPLTHQSYDEWQSIGQKTISADGRYVAWMVNVQEGDGWVEIQSTDRKWKTIIPRGASPVFTDDGQFLLCKVRPTFTATREAKIKKKSPADMPKDSLAICRLGQDSLRKEPLIKSFKVPEAGASSWVAWLLEKPAAIPPTANPAAVPDSAARLQQLLSSADSLVRVADSLRNKVALAKKTGLKALTTAAKPTAAKDDKDSEGTDLVLMNLQSGEKKIFHGTTDYLFNKNGQVLVVEGKKNILWHNLGKATTDSVMRVFNDAKGFAIADDASRLVFYAERDSSSKSLHKYYKLWQYAPGDDSATVLVAGAPAVTSKVKTVLLPETTPWFSDNNQRVFFGVAGEWPVKDTNLVEFETARLDLWSYTDDYLQPQQLVTLAAEKTKSWLGYIALAGGRLQMLGGDSCEMVRVGKKGNADVAIGYSNRGYRIQQQWTVDGMHRIYLVQVADGKRVLVADSVKRGYDQLSPDARFITWYDTKGRSWATYEIKTGIRRLLSKGINTPLFDEEDDHPDDPPAHGLMGWLENDESAFIYDRYDIWQVDPLGIKPAVCITKGEGRKNRTAIRYNRLDPEQDFIRKGEWLLFDLFNYTNKQANWMSYREGTTFRLPAGLQEAVYLSPVKAKRADQFVYQRQTPSTNDLYLGVVTAAADTKSNQPITALNPQQAGYNWFTVELKNWKTLAGQTNEGLLYKPADFDPAKKYPVILYFYERDADTRYRYIEPMPVRASINIAYYTSNGYIVFDPDIKYKTGQPGEDAVNAVLGAANWLAKQPWIDSTKMGIQGHSWGGYQVAYLVTRTNRFAAAEAGAPVSNMTSAYGGIRWGTGISRQFQYEKTQSRLGKTLWEDQQRYLKNSPLFRADKIKTPLLILHNDKDDAVPWYQGIELFTAMKRLNKKAWLVNYNDELHGITERRNRKDWSIRMSQFFDHYLKGKPAPRWMTDGIPARDKGVDFGL